MFKRTFIFTAAMLAVIALLYSVFSFAPEANSKTLAVGTVKVCWGPFCVSAPETTVVNLVSDATGNTVGTCTLGPPSGCCKIQGDFPTGSYHFDYYRPTGTTDCRSGSFDYINGTDVTISAICRCP